MNLNNINKSWVTELLNYLTRKEPFSSKILTHLKLCTISLPWHSINIAISLTEPTLTVGKSCIPSNKPRNRLSISSPKRKKRNN